MEAEKLFELYKKMRRIAGVEDEIANRYYEDVRKMHTPIHLYNGQEAVAVGVCDCLEIDDMVFSTHRCHGHYLAKGGNLNAMIAELYSKRTGCCKGKGGSMHLCDMQAGVAPSSGIVAGNVSVATGYALGNKLRGSNAISCVFFGDGASEEGSVYESICYAKLMNIPILFVCENNGYAINTSYVIREPLKTVSEKFSQIIPAFVVDGNDIEEVKKVTSLAVEKIKNGNGPILIEFITYRTRDHSNIGNGVNESVRTKEEWEEWLKKDPLLHTRAKLISIDEKYTHHIEEYETVLKCEIEKAFQYAEESEFPKDEELWSDIWM